MMKVINLLALSHMLLTMDTILNDIIDTNLKKPPQSSSSSSSTPPLQQLAQLFLV